MLDISPEVVCFIIEKTRQFHVKEDVVIPEEPGNPSGDWAQQVLADHADDPSYQEVMLSVEDLPPERQLILLALMWLGRGDYDISEWDNALADANDSPPEHVGLYLLAHPLAASYLEEGLAQHGYDCEI